MKFWKIVALVFMSSALADGGDLNAAEKASSVNGLAVLPVKSVLTGPESLQRLIVLNRDGDQLRNEAKGVRFSSSDEKVAKVINGVVTAKGNGKVTITATTPTGFTAISEIEVKGIKVANEWSFRRHVIPVLSKQGCNMGSCHGAIAGKGGFRLSLRGYDPETDFKRITREARGRRIELGDPGRSLLLTKSTTALKHTGGRFIEVGSRDYRVLSEWIAAGARPPKEEDARLEKLEVFPELSTLKVGDFQNILVKAHYTDGREEDVTQWAKFTSSNEAVVTTDDKGRVTIVGNGEGAVTAWFSSQIVLARFSAPFPNDIPDEVFTNAPRRNFIDDLVLEQLQRLRLKPSPRSTDSEFIRRVYIDTAGILPTPEETREFLADSAPDKRDRLIDHLLGRKEMVDYWAYRWSDMLLVNGGLLRPEPVKAYYQWIRERVARNEPWDKIVREVVTARGESTVNGATNFFGVHQDPETMAENVTQAFMSLSLACAKCHDHPLDKWTNDQYYAFANLFSRVRAKGWGGDSRSGDGKRTIYVESRGDLIQPRTGKPQPPTPLDAEPLPQNNPEDRREYLADWLTSPDNKHFSRSITNRVWANYFGRGLVDPVDDLRASNPASNETLLAALSAYTVEQKFDLKTLMRLMLQSETYQRSSVALYENRDEDRFFSRQYPRRLMAEVLHDAVVSVTDVPSEFKTVATQKTDFYPKGTRALELYDSAVDSYFLSAFGRNERALACECERSNQPSLIQVLHMSNGNTINDKLSDKSSVVDRLLKKKLSDSQLVEEAYLRCLSRAPTKRELDAYVKILSGTKAKEKKEALEDLFWSIMTSREFLFQH
ncbi:MAG: DUF1553 domain-containing protein [Verrucomicrobia bacterium]|nr:DUF1553 domain-containing protein [Verrucomicrobiota bacterium]